MRSTSADRLKMCAGKPAKPEAPPKPPAQPVPPGRVPETEICAVAPFLDPATLASTLVRVREQVDRRYTAPSSMPNRLSRWLKSLLGVPK